MIWYKWDKRLSTFKNDFLRITVNKKVLVFTRRLSRAMFDSNRLVRIKKKEDRNQYNKQSITQYITRFYK